MVEIVSLQHGETNGVNTPIVRMRLSTYHPII
jgi:hypothetical protein